MHYETIKNAIHFIEENYTKQPSLAEIANAVHMSEHHFQKVFTEWSGISPKKYLQFITLNKAKQLIHNSSNSLYETSLDTGLSGSGRLHDLFVTCEGVTPGEYKTMGKDLTIEYGFYPSRFGQFIIATTEKGICFLMFGEDQKQLFMELKSAWFLSKLIHTPHRHKQSVESIFNRTESISVYTKGTAFQLSVWRALMNIPVGELTTYHSIAKAIHQPKANRAVGSAIGKNIIGYLIPCHRVIRNDGNRGNYRWGIERKRLIHQYEICQIANVSD